MRFKRACMVAAAVAAAFLFSAALHAQGRFRADFIKGYQENRFEYLAIIVKKNKDILPSEIKSLLDEALRQPTFDERMQFLDVASAMASMNKYWHNDEKPLIEVEAAQQAEIKKENERKAEADKWLRYERYPGNILMRDNAAALDKKGLAPVIFPHWLHGLWYDCSACHDSIFQMRRGASPLTHARIEEGELCGSCHNRETAFGAKDTGECQRCHLAGLSGDERLVSASGVDLNEIKNVASRLGAGFYPERLKNGLLPVDRFGFIDFFAMRQDGAYEPVKSIEKDFKGEIRDNILLFEPHSAMNIASVPFSHRSHTERIRCASCHPSIFKDSLGANTVNMRETASGRVCGACHGKAAFKPADCKRCHQGKPAGEQADKVILRGR